MAATLAIAATIVLGSNVAHAGINYTCDPSVTAATCNYLNTIIAAQYNSTFTDANANIYIQYGTTGLASTSAYRNAVPYSDYVAALEANANKSAAQTSGLTALNLYDATPYGSGNVGITVALAQALGLSSDAIFGLTGTTAGGAVCTPDIAGCYNAIVTVTNDPGTPLYYDNLGGAEPSDAYDFYSLVERETDEVLGTASCVGTQASSLSDACDFFGGTGTPSAVDLYRYNAPAVLALNSHYLASAGALAGAYFSDDGGVTNGAAGKVYNTLNNGDDYADFVSSSPDCGTKLVIQDAEGCPGEDAGLTILNDLGGAQPEINILNTVGFDLVAKSVSTPEPMSLAIMLPGVISLIGLRWRRRLSA